jgi:hypothetical protein
MTERAQRQFWYVGEVEVREVTGYECTSSFNLPGDPQNAWWCPEVGYSCFPGQTIFDTKKGAKAALVEKAIRRRAELKDERKMLKKVIRQCS